MWRRRHNDWTEILLVALAAAFAIYSQRTVPVAAAMLAPLAAAPLQDLLGRRTPVGASASGSSWPGVRRSRWWPSPWRCRTRRPTHRTQPAWMDPALRALPPGTKVLDDWDQGGYLMWRHPQLDLMMHGYGDTFTTDELRRNVTLIMVDPGWDASLRESGARIALLRPWSRLGIQLTALEGWQVVHRVRRTSSCSAHRRRGSRRARRWRRDSTQPADAATQRASTSAAAPVSTASATRTSAGGRASSTGAAGVS